MDTNPRVYPPASSRSNSISRSISNSVDTSTSSTMDLTNIVLATTDLSTTASRLAELVDIEDISPGEAGPKRAAHELRSLSAAASRIESSFRMARFGNSQESRLGGQTEAVVISMRDSFTDCEDTLARLETVLSKSSKQGGIAKSILRRRPSVKVNFQLPDVALLMQQVQTYNKMLSLVWFVLNTLLEMPRDRLSVPDFDRQRKGMQTAKTDLRESLAISQDMEAHYSTIAETRLAVMDNRRKRQALDRFIQAADTLFLEIDAKRASFDSQAENRRSFYPESIFSAQSGTSSVSEPIMERPVSQMRLSPLIGGGSPEDEADYDRLMLNRRLKLAEVDMQNRQFKRAEAQLRKCVRDLVEGRDTQELIDVKMKLAVACYGQQKNDEAKKTVASLLDAQLTKDVTLSIKHNLAELNLLSNDLDAAEELGLTVVRGRGILYGTDHILYSQSAKLLADIYTAMGDEDEARIYESYLPETFVPGQSIWTSYDNKLGLPLDLPSPATPISPPISPDPQVAVSPWPMPSPIIHENTVVAPPISQEPQVALSPWPMPSPIIHGNTVASPQEMPPPTRASVASYAEEIPPPTRMSVASYAEEKILVTPDEMPASRASVASYYPDDKIFIPPEEVVPFHKLSLGGAAPPEEKILVTSPTDSSVSRKFSVSKQSAVESGKLLVKAASEGKADATAALIAEGATLIEADDMKWTATMWAAWEGHDSILSQLLEAGAPTESIDLDGRTALILAATAGNVMTTETLLAKGARIDTRSNVGRTALMYAASKGHDHVCRLLVAKGAVVTGKDNLGRTAVTHAKASKNSNLVTFLKARAKG